MDSFGKNDLHFSGFVIRIYGCVKMPPQIKLSFEQMDATVSELEANNSTLPSPTYFPMFPYDF